jgi:hypothetical protein
MGDQFATEGTEQLERDMTTTAGRAGGDGVLLTGATGFLGMKLLARYLERTDRLHAHPRP